MRKFIPLTVFSIAFAMVEAAVVVYLRKLYYPDGFGFPINPIPSDILFVEVLREASTFAILASVAVASGAGRLYRFSYFIYCFGLWDIFYYVWLKALIGWPASFLTPDILFLIPVVWWGPVLAPMIVAFSLCGASLYVVYKMDGGFIPCFRRSDFVWIVSGAAVIFYTFMADAAVIGAGGTPPPYRWLLFLGGEGVGLVAFAGIMRRGKQQSAPPTAIV
jgi:hypothetical protein